MKNQNAIIFSFFIFLAFILYLPTLSAPWQFDDLEYVLRRNTVGQENLGDLLLATISPIHRPPGTRTLVNATFLLNWKISEQPLGFHLVNILIHAGTSFVVFLLLKEILGRYEHYRNGWRAVRVYPERGNSESKENPGHNPPINRKVIIWSFFGALLFLVHPIQSQAVAYITQRFESLSSFFYLLCFYLFMTKRYARAWIAGFLAASSKETALTLPLVLILWDLLFDGKIMYRLRRRLLLYGFFLLLGVKIVVQLTLSPAQTLALFTQPRELLSAVSMGSQVSENHRSLTRTTYLLTQFNVIPTYMRLLFIPYGQTIDYDFPITSNFWQWPTPFSFLFLVTLCVIGVVLWKKQPIISFAVLFFFLTLSITSSIFPIDDVINEHRLYLPMFGFVLLVVWVSEKIKNINFIKIIFFIIIIFFSLLTFRRSIVWSSPLFLWEDAWKKAPHKARTNKNYGFLLTEARRLPEGIARLEEAVTLQDTSDYHRNLGLAYLQAGKIGEAQREFQVAIDKDPDDPRPWSDLGVALAQQGKNQEALLAFHKAIELDPNQFEGLIGYGGISVLTGDYKTAEEFLLKAMHLAPSDTRPINNLFVLYLRQKNAAKARDMLDKLATLDPNYPGLADKYEEIKKLH